MSKKRISWKIEKRKLADLKPHPKNPRQFTDKGMKDLENSINSIGFMQPININQDGTILSGHARTLKLQQMGEIEVDVYVPDRLLTPKQEEEVLVRANANTAGQWDFDILANEFEDFELVEWGLEIPAIETEELEAKEDDFDGEPPAEPITVLGDLYEIGEHRLLCGDSTCSDTVAKLMNGEKADMVFTDPPYGIDYSGGRTQVVETKTYGKLMNDDLQGAELGELISNVFLFNKQEADVYICVSPKMQKPFLDFIENSNKIIDAVIVWDKKQPGLGYMSYRRQCEFILFIKGGNFKKGDTSDFDLWSISRDNGKDYVHGTQKPIKVPSRAINNSSKKDDLVLDFFLGSGSTMVASHQLKRKCYGMELDPKNCDVIIKRMIKLYTSLKITRNGEECKQQFIKND
jgi:DNA modification methylase